MLHTATHRHFSVVCFADLPPTSSSKTGYLVRRLRPALPELRIARREVRCLGQTPQLAAC